MTPKVTKIIPASLFPVIFSPKNNHPPNSVKTGVSAPIYRFTPKPIGLRTVSRRHCPRTSILPNTSSTKPLSTLATKKKHNNLSLPTSPSKPFTSPCRRQRHFAISICKHTLVGGMTCAQRVARVWRALAFCQPCSRAFLCQPQSPGNR